MPRGSIVSSLVIKFVETDYKPFLAVLGTDKGYKVITANRLQWQAMPLLGIHLSTLVHILLITSLHNLTINMLSSNVTASCLLYTNM